MFYITANVGHEYTGTFQLDVALESRLTVQVAIDHMPKKVEVGICTEQVGCPKFVSEYATNVTHFMREFCPSSRDSSPRATIAMARLLNTGIERKYWT